MNAFRSSNIIIRCLIVDTNRNLHNTSLHIGIPDARFMLFPPFEDCNDVLRVCQIKLTMPTVVVYDDLRTKTSAKSLGHFL